jgi:RimJ/RimL family protein N-acetyltransferase
VSGAEPPTVVELRAVSEELLERMVRAAVTDAAANEVTAPVTPGDEWTPERLDWMRALHRDSRAGLDGPARQATWAVVADGAVVGAVRLKRTDEPGVLETGIWLTRGARHRGVGRRAIAAVLEKAGEAGAVEVSADTSTGNRSALALLRALGFECSPAPDGERVLARLRR